MHIRFAGLTLLLGLSLAMAWAVASQSPPLPRLPFDAEKAVALRAEWARAFGLEEAFTNALGMRLVLIPGGRFDLGSKGSTHRVSLAKPYYLGVTEVTPSPISIAVVAWYGHGLK